MSNPSTPFNMRQVNQSGFQLFSIGIVAQNKDLASGYIEATPIEDTQNLQGELTDHIYQYQSQGKDFSGVSYQTNTKTAATIKCKWLALGQSNRMTAPDVRRGEKVQIFRMANSEHFFWDTMVNDSNTRRLETVVYAYSGTQEEDTQLNDDNCYTQGVSTHNKMVNLIHTTQANKEEYSYDINVNTKENKVTVKDNIGNEIIIESGNARIYIKNSNGSIVDLNKDDIFIKSNSTVNIETRELNIKTENINSDGKQAHRGRIDTTEDVTASGISLNSHDHTSGVGNPV